VSKGPKPSSDEAHRRMKAVRQRDTKAEMEVRRRLHAMGLRYRVDYPVLESPRRRADVAFPRLRIAVFIDGCFWHGCPIHGSSPKANAEFWKRKIEANVARDRDTDERLRAKGWTVLRFWEHEDPDRVAGLIRKSVEAARRVGRFEPTGPPHPA